MLSDIALRLRSLVRRKRVETELDDDSVFTSTSRLKNRFVRASRARKQRGARACYSVGRIR
jgi:hypothetical protein